MNKVQFPDLELFLTYKTVSPSSRRVMTWMYDCESSSRLSYPWLGECYHTQKVDPYNPPSNLQIHAKM